MIKKPTFIDLFAGAGGLSEGFIQAGFEPIAHVEIDTAASFTLKTRAAYHFLKDNGKNNIYEEYLRGNISRHELYSKIPDEIKASIINKPIGEEFNNDIFNQIDFQINGKEIDFIVGGPPCQAYSLAGRSRSENNMKKDPRNFLYVQYANYLARYNPKMFVFENVFGLLSAGKGIYLQNMERLFNKKGYKIHIFKVKAENFGVLQKRRRLIIVGWKDDFTPNLPDFDNYKSNISGMVKDIFSDLEPLKAGEGVDKFSLYKTQKNDYLDLTKIRNGSEIVTQHIARPHSEQDKEIYQLAVNKWDEKRERINYNDFPERLKTHQNRHSFTDRFKVVAQNIEASQTVVAHIAKDGHYYIHPDIYQNRSISVREAARIQSFPDNFYFEGVKEGANRTAAFKQIGNAVPVLLANLIGENMKKLICQ